MDLLEINIISYNWKKIWTTSFGTCKMTSGEFYQIVGIKGTRLQLFSVFMSLSQISNFGRENYVEPVWVWCLPLISWQWLEVCNIPQRREATGGCWLPKRYSAKGLYISSIWDKEAFLLGSWRYLQAFWDGKFCRKCFQIVAISKELSSAAGICVEQRGTEIAEILQVFIEHLLWPGHSFGYLKYIDGKKIETLALMGLTFKAVELQCLKSCSKSWEIPSAYLRKDLTE